MKLPIMLALAAAVSSAAFAAKPAPKPAKPVTEVACPIMSANKVNIAKATKTKMFADHNGRRYFFCCAGCPEAFKKNPAKYAKAPSIPTPKVKH
jgi:YHS domain-containing protein